MEFCLPLISCDRSLLQQLCLTLSEVDVLSLGGAATAWAVGRHTMLVLPC